jgi:hypothetical protein
LRPPRIAELRLANQTSPIADFFSLVEVAISVYIQIGVSTWHLGKRVIRVGIEQP